MRSKGFPVFAHSSESGKGDANTKNKNTDDDLSRREDAKTLCDTQFSKIEHLGTEEDPRSTEMVEIRRLGCFEELQRTHPELIDEYRAYFLRYMEEVSLFFTKGSFVSL